MSSEKHITDNISQITSITIIASSSSDVIVWLRYGSFLLSFVSDSVDYLCTGCVLLFWSCSFILRAKYARLLIVHFSFATSLWLHAAEIRYVAS